MIQSAVLNDFIVFIRQPRVSREYFILPEFFHPGRIEPATDLLPLPADGSEEVRVAGSPGARTWIPDKTKSFPHFVDRAICSQGPGS